MERVKAALNYFLDLAPVYNRLREIYENPQVPLKDRRRDLSQIWVKGFGKPKCQATTKFWLSEADAEGRSRLFVHLYFWGGHEIVSSLCPGRFDLEGFLVFAQGVDLFSVQSREAVIGNYLGRISPDHGPGLILKQYNAWWDKNCPPSLGGDRFFPTTIPEPSWDRYLGTLQDFGRDLLWSEDRYRRFFQLLPFREGLEWVVATGLSYADAEHLAEFLILSCLQTPALFTDLAEVLPHVTARQNRLHLMDAFANFNVCPLPVPVAAGIRPWTQSEDAMVSLTASRIVGEQEVK